MITHDFFACASRRAARAVHKHGEAKSNPVQGVIMTQMEGAQVWLYQFNYSAHWVDNKLMGDYHASELPFVWGNQWPPVVHHFDEKDSAI